MDDPVTAITDQMQVFAPFSGGSILSSDCSQMITRFHSMKRWDRYRQLKWMVPIVAVLFLLLAYVVNFSVWTPFGSMKGNLLLLFSVRFWTAAVLQLLGVAALWSLLVNYVFSVTYESNLDLWKRENWLATAFIFAFHVTTSLLLAFWAPVGASIWFSSRSFFVLWLCSTAFSSLSSGFLSDFAYSFAEPLQPVGSEDGQKWWWQVLQVPDEMKKRLVVPVKRCLIRSAWIVCDAWMAAFVLGIVVKPLRSSWPQLFLLHSLVDFFALVLCQQILVGALVYLANYSYMGKVIEFPIPKAYYSIDGLRNYFSLPTALQCNDPVLKLFALRYLRDVCMRVATRQQIFELSQPGGYPRNWMALRSAATFHINEAPKVSTYEMECAIYVYEAVEMVTMQREIEDKYGVMSAYPLELNPSAVSLLKRTIQHARQRRKNGGDKVLGGWDKLVVLSDIQAAVEGFK